MSPPIRLRLLTPRDLAFAEVVRAAAGWNQTPADWRRFLELEPSGCFLAEWEGAPAGTATTLVHGPELAWIGMVLVHPDYRRRGIGRALLEHCLGHLQARGVQCIKLDATPLGQPVYERLGFRAEWTLARWERAGQSSRVGWDAERAGHEAGRARLLPSRLTLHHAPTRQEIPADPGRPGTCGSEPLSVRRHSWPGQWDDGSAGASPYRTRVHWQPRPTAWGSLDATAFGVARQRLLDALERPGSTARAIEAADGTVAAFGLSRPGSRARYLGPVVATSPEAGLAAIEALLAEHPEEAVFRDIPEPNEAAVAWAGAHGFQRQRPLTRMYLGENLNPGDPARQFALAGPEVG